MGPRERGQRYDPEGFDNLPSYERIRKVKRVEYEARNSRFKGKPLSLQPSSEVWDNEKLVR